MPRALDDFFGAGYLGVDPYAEARSAKLDEMTSMQAAAQSRTQQRPPQGYFGMPGNMSPQAFQMMSRGYGGDYMPGTLDSAKPKSRENPDPGGPGPRNPDPGGPDPLPNPVRPDPENPRPDPCDPADAPDCGTGTARCDPRTGEWTCEPRTDGCEGTPPPTCGGGTVPVCTNGYWGCKGTETNPGACPPDQEPECEEGYSSQCGPQGWRCVRDRDTPRPERETRYGNWDPGGQGTLPPDLNQFRQQLMGWLSGRSLNGQMYPGKLEVPWSNFSNAAYNSFANANDFGYSPARSSYLDAAGLYNQGGNTLGAAMGTLWQGDKILPQAMNSLWQAPGLFQGAQGAYDAMGGGMQYLDAGRSAMPYAMDQSYLQAGMGSLQQGSQIAGNLGNFGVGADMNPAWNAYGAALPGWQQMMRNGGFQDLSAGFGAIDTATDVRLKNALAGIREQYGAMGLGRGSDISAALGQGAAETIAGAGVQKQQMLQSGWQASQNNMLSAMGLMPQYSGTASSLAQVNPNLAIQSAGIRGQAAGMLPSMAGQYGAFQGVANQGALGVMNALPGYANSNAGIYQGMGQGYQGLGGAYGDLGMNAVNVANAYGNLGNNVVNVANAYGNMGSGMAGIGQGFTGIGQGFLGQGAGMTGLGEQDMANQRANQQAAWQAWNATQGPNAYGNAALGLGTNFPPVSNQQSTGSAWAGAAGAIGGSAMASILPWLLLSSRTVKDDIVELKPGEALAKLKRLPLTTWRYKGDSQKHLGPIAEEWHDTFGIGDGKTLFIPDMLGVLLASVKDLAYGTR